jgi:hypothetical protein
MKRILFPLSLVIIIVQTGCLKSPDFEELSANFVVITNTDSSKNFSNFKTYYISDTVAYHTDVVKDSIINNASSKQLVDAVKQNMNALGYNFVSKAAKPDLGINLGVLKNTSVSVIYSGWWDYWYGWWDPWYWGAYYPYYYPWAYAYSITTGTVIATMIDVKEASADQQFRVVWMSVMSGAVGDNVTTNVQRGVDAINQSFKQSPLLKHN